MEPKDIAGTHSAKLTEDRDPVTSYQGNEGRVKGRRPLPGWIFWPVATTFAWALPVVFMTQKMDLDDGMTMALYPSGCGLAVLCLFFEKQWVFAAWTFRLLNIVFAGLWILLICFLKGFAHGFWK